VSGRLRPRDDLAIDDLVESEEDCGIEVRDDWGVIRDGELSVHVLMGNIDEDKDFFDVEIHRRDGTNDYWVVIDTGQFLDFQAMLQGRWGMDSALETGILTEGIFTGVALAAARRYDREAWTGALVFDDLAGLPWWRRVVEQIVQDPQIRRETEAIKQAGRWEDHPERHGRWSLRTDEPA